LVIARTPGSIPIRADVRFTTEPGCGCGMRKTGTVLPGAMILTWSTSASMKVPSGTGSYPPACFW